VLPGGSWSVAFAANDHDVVVGYGESLPSGVSHAIRWSDGTTIDLGVLPGYLRSFAFGITNDGLIMGWCTGPGLWDKAFVWKNGVMHALDDLVPRRMGLHVLRADAVNSLGSIAASGYLIAGTDPALILTPGRSPPTDLTGDCQTGPYDLAILLANWGNADSAADLNADGTVNAVDLAMLLANWG
jgi:probable HAF family extracellular repeat protein